MNFKPERLISLRQALGINKAEAARRLNMSAMGYGRYESGAREPSYQTVAYIAQVFNCSIEYLYGETDKKDVSVLTVSSKDEPDLFLLVESARNDKDMLNRLLTYAEKIKTQ